MRGMDNNSDSNYVNDLRNFHVKKLLNKFGGKFCDESLQKAVKKSYSEFAEDIINKKDIKHGHEDHRITR